MVDKTPSLEEIEPVDDSSSDSSSTPMPEENLPATEISGPDMAAGYPLSSYPLCPNDGFPMVMIEGELTCSVEALDRCLGGQKVVDVTERDNTVYFVFDDRHQLPLLCGCCGQSLQFTNIAGVRKEIRGRRLTEMSLETRVIEEESREYDQLIMTFSKSRLGSQPAHLGVAFEVAVALRHPPHATSTPVQSPIKQKKQPKKKKSSAPKTQTGKKKSAAKRRRRKKK